MKDIIKPSNEVLSEATLLKISCSEIEYSCVKKLWYKILECFANRKGVYEYPLWENLSNSVGVRYTKAWELFPSLLFEKEIVLFFENEDDKKMILFPNGSDLSIVFDNCYKFTFYITNLSTSFLLSYNDHDYLIGGGEAISWLESIEENI